MAEIRFKDLRITFWNDNDGENTESRPLTPEEVNKVRGVIGDLLFGDHALDSQIWIDVYEEFAPGDPRVGEIDWDEEIIY